MAVTTSRSSAAPRPAADVSILDSAMAPADPQALAQLRAGTAAADLVSPPVALPDFHLKGDKEMPSSIAIATRDTIRPTYSSASLNCGMALVSLKIDRPSAAAVADFFRRVRERHPSPPTYRRDLTAEDVVRCAAEGGRFAVDRFGIDPHQLDRVEEHGHLSVERYGGLSRVRRELPWSVKQLSRIRFASIGRSNHFIELQEVEEILDPRAASLLGLERGQVTMQYHGGGGSLPGELGMLFGRRKRYPLPVRLQMAAQKPLYHFGRARSIRALRRRRELYFSGSCPPIDRMEPEGERVMLANAMAMNYGFAFRLAAYASLTELLREAVGDSGETLVVDSPHNTIYEEQLGGVPAIVHRHNACRIYPAETQTGHPVFGRIGRPLLLPGTSRTASYVCIPGDRPEVALNSASHGAGDSIKRFAKAGLSQVDPRGRTTLRFDYAASQPVELPHLDDRGVDDVMTTLITNGVLRPVARLRPFAVLN